MTWRRGVSWLGLVLGIAALLLQAGLTIPLRLGNGDSIFGAMAFYLTFLSILANMALAVIYLTDLNPRAGLTWFRAPVTRGMMAAMTALVLLFYHFFLRPAWQPIGLWWLADTTLHYVTPILYLLWWALFAWHGRLKFSNIPAMLVPVLIYLVCTMLRGALIGEYPYPILEANRLGYGQVAIGLAVMLVAMALLCAIVVAADRLLGNARLPS